MNLTDAAPRRDDPTAVSRRRGTYTPLTLEEAATELIRRLEREPDFDPVREWGLRDPETGEPLHVGGRMPDAPVLSDSRHQLAWLLSQPEDQRPEVARDPETGEAMLRDSIGRAIRPLMPELRRAAMEHRIRKYAEVEQRIRAETGYKGLTKKQLEELDKTDPREAQAERERSAQYFRRLELAKPELDREYERALTEYTEAAKRSFAPPADHLRRVLADQIARRRWADEVDRLERAVRVGGEAIERLPESWPLTKLTLRIALGDLLLSTHKYLHSEERDERHRAEAAAIEPQLVDAARLAQIAAGMRNLAYAYAPGLLSDDRVEQARSAAVLSALPQDAMAPIAEAIASQAAAKREYERQVGPPTMPERSAEALRRGAVSVLRTLTEWPFSEEKVRRAQIEGMAAEATDPGRGLGIIGRGWVGALENLMPMLPAGGLFASGNRLLRGVGVLFWTKLTVPDEYARLVRDGLDPAIAVPASVVSSYAQALVETMSPAPFLSKPAQLTLEQFKRRGLRDMFKGIFRQWFTEAIAEEGLQGVISEMGRTFATALDMKIQKDPLLKLEWQRIGLPADWFTRGARDAAEAIVPMMFLLAPGASRQAYLGVRDLDYARAATAEMGAMKAIAEAHKARAARMSLLELIDKTAGPQGAVAALDQQQALAVQALLKEGQLAPLDHFTLTAPAPDTVAVNAAALRIAANTQPLAIDPLLDAAARGDFSRSAIPLRSRMERQVFAHTLLAELMPERYRELAARHGWQPETIAGGERFQGTVTVSLGGAKAEPEQPGPPRFRTVRRVSPEFAHLLKDEPPASEEGIPETIDRRRIVSMPMDVRTNIALRSLKNAMRRLAHLAQPLRALYMDHAARAVANTFSLDRAELLRTLGVPEAEIAHAEGTASQTGGQGYGQGTARRPLERLRLWHLESGGRRPEDILQPQDAEELQAVWRPPSLTAERERALARHAELRHLLKAVNQAILQEYLAEKVKSGKRAVIGPLERIDALRAMSGAQYQVRTLGGEIVTVTRTGVIQEMRQISAILTRLDEDDARISSDVAGKLLARLPPEIQARLLMTDAGLSAAARAPMWTFHPLIADLIRLYATNLINVADRRYKASSLDVPPQRGFQRHKHDVFLPMPERVRRLNEIIAGTEQPHQRGVLAAKTDLLERLANGRSEHLTRAEAMLMRWGDPRRYSPALMESILLRLLAVEDQDLRRAAAQEALDALARGKQNDIASEAVYLALYNLTSRQQVESPDDEQLIAGARRIIRAFAGLADEHERRVTPPYRSPLHMLPRIESLLPADYGKPPELPPKSAPALEWYEVARRVNEERRGGRPPQEPGDVPVGSWAIDEKGDLYQLRSYRTDDEQVIVPEQADPIAAETYAHWAARRFTLPAIVGAERADGRIVITRGAEVYRGARMGGAGVVRIWVNPAALDDSGNAVRMSYAAAVQTAGSDAAPSAVRDSARPEAAGSEKPTGPLRYDWAGAWDERRAPHVFERPAPDMVRRPPGWRLWSGLAAFHSGRTTRIFVRGGTVEERKKMGRLPPLIKSRARLGDWMVTPKDLLLWQARRIRVDDPRLTSPPVGGKLVEHYAKVFTPGIRSGMGMPEIMVRETADGKLHVVYGARVLAGLRKAGVRSVRAWVNPLFRYQQGGTVQSRPLSHPFVVRAALFRLYEVSQAYAELADKLITDPEERAIEFDLDQLEAYQRELADARRKAGTNRLRKLLKLERRRRAETEAEKPRAPPAPRTAPAAPPPGAEQQAKGAPPEQPAVAAPPGAEQQAKGAPPEQPPGTEQQAVTQPTSGRPSNWVTQARQRLESIMGGLEAEIAKTLRELARGTGDVLSTLGLPPPEMVKAAARLVKLVIERGVYRFADAVLAIMEAVPQHIEELKGYLVDAWNTARAADQRLDEAVDVDGIIQEIRAADSAAQRPPLRVIDERHLPQVPDHIGELAKSDTRGKRIAESLAEHQKLAVNLIVDRYIKGGGGFMLADGAGTGKTRMQLAAAYMIHMRSNRPVLIIAPNESIITTSHVREATAMGIDALIGGHYVEKHLRRRKVPRPIMIETYSKVTKQFGDIEKMMRDGKEWRNDPTLLHNTRWGLVVYDEAHFLKNPDSTAHTFNVHFQADYKLFCTATPMDKAFGAAYFLSEIMNPSGRSEYQRRRDLNEICEGLGFSLSEEQVEVGQGENRRLAVRRVVRLNRNMTWDLVRKNLIRMRGKAVAMGAMLRRELPFWGRMYWHKVGSGDMRPEELQLLHTVQAFYEAKNRGGGDSMSSHNALTREMDYATEYTKVPVVLDMIRRSLASGRNVIVLSSYAGPLKLTSMTQLAYGEQAETDKDKALCCPGFLQELSKALDAEKIPHAKLYQEPEYVLGPAPSPEWAYPTVRHVRPNPEARERNFVREIERFQKGNVRVLIGLLQSGGTGIDLDDQKGDRPRDLIIVTPPWAGDRFEQAIFRVSRKNTATPARVYCVVQTASYTDVKRVDVMEHKLTVLRAIQAGADPDLLLPLEDAGQPRTRMHPQYDVERDPVLEPWPVEDLPPEMPPGPYVGEYRWGPGSPRWTEGEPLDEIDLGGGAPPEKLVSSYAYFDNNAQAAAASQQAATQRTLNPGAPAKRLGIKPNNVPGKAGGPLVPMNQAPPHPDIVPLTPDPREGAITIPTIMAALEKLFARFMQTRQLQPRVMGEYWPETGLLVVRPGLFLTAAHEFGHHLDHLLELASANNPEYDPFIYDPELSLFWWYTSSQSSSEPWKRHEGVANFVRVLMINPAEARRRAPYFTRYFVRSIRKLGPTFLRDLRRISDLMRMYFGQNPLLMAAANTEMVQLYERANTHRNVVDRIEAIRTHPADRAVSRFLRRFSAVFGDALAPVWYALRTAYQMSGLRQYIDVHPSEDPFVRIAQARSGAQSVVLAVLRYGPFNPMTRRPIGYGPVFEYLYKPLVDAALTQDDFLMMREMLIGLLNAQRIDERASQLEAALLAVRRLGRRMHDLQEQRRKLNPDTDADAIKRIDAELEEIPPQIMANLKVIYGKHRKRLKRNEWQLYVGAYPPAFMQLQQFVRKRQELLAGVSGGGRYAGGDWEIARRALAELGRMKLSSDREKQVADALIEASIRYREITNWLLSYAAYHGRIKETAVLAIRSSNQFYVSWERALRGYFGVNEGELENMFGRGATIMRRGAVTHEMYGSGRPIIDPFLLLQAAIVRIITECEYNTAAASFAKAFEGLSAPGEDVFDVPPADYARWGFRENNIFKMLAALRRRGINAIPYYENGRLRVFRTTREIVEAFESMEPTTFRWWIVAAPARLYHWSITHSPAFLIRSVLREAVSAQIVGTPPPPEPGTKPPKKVLKQPRVFSLKDRDFGFLSSFPLPGKLKQYTDDELAEYLAHGGIHLRSALFSLDAYEAMQRHVMAAMLRARKLPARASGPWGLLRKLVPLSYRIMDAFEDAVVEPEVANRMAIYRRVRRHAERALGMSPYEAAWFAAYVTNQYCDYAKQGSLLRTFGRVLPFVAARIAAFQRTYASLRRPYAARQLLMRIAAFTLPLSAMEYAFNASQGDDAEREFWQLPHYVRDFFWAFKVGDFWATVPKPYELGILASLFTRTLQRLRGDRRAFDGFAGNAIQAFLPVGANDLEFVLFRGVLEWLANYNFWRGETIISPYELPLAPSERPGRRRATLLGQLGARLAAAFGYDTDPRMYDYIVRATVPGLGWLIYNLPEARSDPLATISAMTGLITRVPHRNARDADYVIRQARRIGVMQAPEFLRLETLLRQYTDLPKNAYRERASLARLIQEEGTRLRDEWEEGLGRRLQLRQLAVTLSQPPPSPAEYGESAERYDLRIRQYRDRIAVAKERFARLNPTPQERTQAIIMALTYGGVNPYGDAGEKRMEWYVRRLREIFDENE